MSGLPEDEVRLLLRSLAGWEVRGGTVTKQFRFSENSLLRAFLRRVAAVAYAADHYPRFHMERRKLTITLGEEGEEGIDEMDIHLARQIEEVAVGGGDIGFPGS